jgi:tRNA G10  N-methylase Trm11
MKNQTTTTAQKELSILEQIELLKSQLTAKEQAKLNDKNKTEAQEFEAKEKQTTTDIKNYLETAILETIENCRVEIQNKFESNEWLETCIDTTKQYISIGVTQLNPKAKDNKSDKNLKVNLTFRTFADLSNEANKKQNKDVAKTIKTTSSDKIKSFERSQVDVTLDKIAERSGIKK